MKITDWVRVACYNLGADKKGMKKIIFGMTVIFVLVTCFIVVFHSYKEYKAEFNDRHKRDCYYYTEITEQMIGSEQISGLMEKQEEVFRQYSADCTMMICDIMSRNETVDMRAGKVRITADGEIHSAKSLTARLTSANISENITDNESLIDIALFQKGMRIVPDFFDVRVTGRYPEEQGEIMLDDYILEVFGFNDPFEELVGKTVSISFQKDKKRQVLLGNYKLVGVVNSDFLSARESMETSDLHLEHIYVNLKEEDRKEFQIGRGSIRYYFDDYSKYVAGYDQSEELIRLNLEQVMSGGGEIQVTPKGMEYCVIVFLMENVGKLLLILAIVISLIIFFSVSYLFHFYWNRQRQYRTMLVNIGMQKMDRRGIRMVEITFFVIISFLISCYFSAIILLLLNYVSTMSLGFSIRVM